MSEHTILSPTHATLIAAARLRDDCRLVPPERVRGAARRRLADKLLALGLVQAVPGEVAAWWVDPDRGLIGLRLAADTDGDASRTGPAGQGSDDPPIDEPSGREAPFSQPAEPRSWTKIARVLTLLRRGEGVDLQTLSSATGWLPHTARAALTGLRRKGHAILSERRETDGRIVYRIVPEPEVTSVTTDGSRAASAALS